jgi:hypothetical protein
LNSRVLAKKIAALIERNRMRQSASEIVFFHATTGDQVMNDPQAEFALNENVPRKQQVGVFSNGSGKCIFDRNDYGGDFARLQLIKNFDRARAWHHGTIRHHSSRGLVAERPEFPLNGNFHFCTLSEGSC